MVTAPVNLRRDCVGALTLLLMFGDFATESGLSQAGDQLHSVPSYRSDLIVLAGGEFRYQVRPALGHALTTNGSTAAATSVSSFAIHRFLVSAEEFSDFLNDEGNHGFYVENTGWIDWRTIRQTNGRYEPQRFADRSPAFPVTWLGATEYCRWLSKREGRTYRLPSELEWEYAARGTELRSWPWGESAPLGTTIENRFNRTDGSAGLDCWLDALPSQAEATQRRGCPPSFLAYGLRWLATPFDPGHTWIQVPVGSFPRNATPDGLYDMVGYYAGQWCADVFDGQEDPGSNAAFVAADIAKAGRPRVLRGMHNVSVKYQTGDRPLISFRWFLGDGGWPQYEEARVWSRVGADEAAAGAMFRVASTPD